MPEFSIFAVTAPGLEPFAAQELRKLNAAGISPTIGGVEFRGSRSDLYRANLRLRTASRILVRLGEFCAAAFSELRQKAGRLPWENFLAPGQPVALKVTCRKSRLYHSGAVAERIAGAIEDRLGRGVTWEKGDDQPETTRRNFPAQAQLIVIRLAHDQCAISVDASGALLHHRGYRLATAKAPLRETLAAGMLLASGWDAVSPLLDPFCGSGTIPIEAALLAKNIAPGRTRRFAFMYWPDYDPALWESLTKIGARGGRPAESLLPPILASDRDAGAVEAAQANAARAGVADAIQFSCRAVSAVQPPPGPGWVVTNPPYGTRLGGSQDLRNLYAQFGHVMRAKCSGWRVAMLSGGAQLARSVGLDFDDAQSVRLVNGGLKVRLMMGIV